MVHLRPAYVPLVVRPQASLVRTGADASAEVGAGAAGTAGAVLFYGAATVALGALAYALIAGQWIVTAKHPVWGGIVAFFALGTALSAGDRLSSGS